MDIFITSTVVMVSQVDAYVQTQQIVCIKYVQFFMYQLYLSKAVFKKGNLRKGSDGTLALGACHGPINCLQGVVLLH